MEKTEDYSSNSQYRASNDDLLRAILVASLLTATLRNIH